ncbi:hypothetical protein [Xanthobacter sediminis]
MLRADFNVWTTRRAEAPEGLVAAPIARASYEDGRPSAEEACRIGDPRILARS